MYTHVRQDGIYVYIYTHTPDIDKHMDLRSLLVPAESRMIHSLCLKNPSILGVSHSLDGAGGTALLQGSSDVSAGHICRGLDGFTKVVPPSEMFVGLDFRFRWG